MIEVEIKFVSNEPSELCDAGPTASVANFRHGYPADVLIKFRNIEMHETSFACPHYNAPIRKRLPAIEVAQWKDILLLIGKMKWILIKLSDTDAAEAINLCRNSNEDSGFYHISFHELSGLLIVVYESGLFAISGEGKVVWHRKKKWDDILVSTHEDRLVFCTFEDDEFAICTHTGEDWIDGSAR